MNIQLSASTFTRIKVEPLTPSIGAEIFGVDLRDELSDAMIAEIRAALLKHKVIFFRDQDITTEQHIAFARRFGELEIHPATKPEQPNPEVLHIKHGPDSKGRENHWHSDVTWREKPSLGSILRNRATPEVGGDTLFACMASAYEGLSPAMKQWVCSLTAIHDIAPHFGKLLKKSAEELHKDFPAQEHPVVRTHPETGARSLYVNTAFATHIKDLNKAESRWLLDHLFAQAAIPEYQCRFRWRPNSIAFWDNRACQHLAVSDYFPEVREMERVTIAGDKPFFRP
jgi:taurine dioxygenase